MDVNDRVSVTIGLSAVPATTARFTVGLLLVDHADIPVDRRYIIVTNDDYTTDLTAATDQLGWCTTLWGQTNSPAQAYIGRWIDTATASHAICPNATSVASVYAALTNTGQLGILEAGSAVVDINPDFTGDTTMAQVCASIEAAMSGVVASYTCALDALDRVVITSDNTGASAAAVSLQTPAAGIDLTGAAYLGTEFSVAGFDAETHGAALTAVRAKSGGNVPYIICQRGADIAEAVAFSTTVNALDKYLLLVSNDANAKDSAQTSDFCYQIEALSHQKTHMTYTEHHTDNGAAADEHPDAAIIGEVLQELEGSTNLANTPFSSVKRSGLDTDKTTDIELTATEEAALTAKGCDWLTKPANSVHLAHGLSAGGHEVRVMIAKSWMANQVATGIYNYLLSQPVVTFSNSDIAVMETEIRRVADILVDRKCLDSDYTITMPDAADFTSAQKATHTMTLSDVGNMNVQVSANSVAITFDWTV